METTHCTPEMLERTFVRASARPEFLAYWFTLYAAREELTLDALADRLHGTRAGLVSAGLCLSPERARYPYDLTAVTARFGLDLDATRAVLLAVGAFPEAEVRP